jgi:uncharacterized membrane protein YphA (DoxX/SURF4 family)
MLISVGLAVLLKFAGIQTGIDLLWLGINGDLASFSSGALFAAIASILAIGGGASIVIGFFTKAQSETFIVSLFALSLFTYMVSTFIAIVNYASGYGFVYYIVYLIFVPWIIAFAISIIRFWRGVD